MTNSKKDLQLAIFAAGCFWGVEETFHHVKGVKETMVGYTGGHTENPSYEDVCTGTTGHAESVQIKYDPKEVDYESLLNVFWENHDPTQINRQGPDFGEQYRSVIFYHNEKQREAAERSKAELEKSDRYQNKIVTQIVKAGLFYRAEEYHQKYYHKHDFVSCLFPGQEPRRFN